MRPPPLPTMYFGYVAGAHKGKVMTITAPHATLGTAHGCEVPFDPTADAPCAPVHARVGLHMGHIVVFDLCPMIGTFVNGEAVTHHKILKSKDVIQLGRGGPQIRFYLDQDVKKCPICQLPLYKKHYICPACGQKVCLRCVDQAKQRCSFCASRTGRI